MGPPTWSFVSMSGIRSHDGLNFRKMNSVAKVEYNVLWRELFERPCSGG